jgi:hypothetical protein
VNTQGSEDWFDSGNRSSETVVGEITVKDAKEDRVVKLDGLEKNGKEKG